MTSEPVATTSTSAAYSRDRPSARYRALVALYQEMHTKGEPRLALPPTKTFAGFSLLRQIDRIKQLIALHQARTVLDYGSGKGKAYEPRALKLTDGTVIDSLAAYWGVDHVTCYDPGYSPFSTLPTEQFDGVIAVDVLEHCPIEDMPWIVAELFGFARRFVFANVVSFAALKTLPNGENAHVTIQPAAWWNQLFRDVASGHPGVKWKVFVEAKTESAEVNARTSETCIEG